ncbi:MAG: hypothetical protein ACT4O2_08175, partial [Beijerinckiaceae bacterium]
MALVRCSECGGRVSTTAPHCLALLWQNYFCVNPETHSAAGTSFMDLHSEERLDDGSPDRRE